METKLSSLHINGVEYVPASGVTKPEFAGNGY